MGRDGGLRCIAAGGHPLLNHAVQDEPCIQTGVTRQAEDGLPIDRGDRVHDAGIGGVLLSHIGRALQREEDAVCRVGVASGIADEGVSQLREDGQD